MSCLKSIETAARRLGYCLLQPVLKPAGMRPPGCVPKLLADNLIGVNTRRLQRRSVRVNDFAVGSQNTNKLKCLIEDAAELCFTRL